jgi:hypothetical protein
MWTIKGADEGVDKATAQATIKAKLESLIGKIDGLLSLQVGVNSPETPESFDVCLITEHTDWQALKHYQEHPDHKAVGAYIGQVKKSRAVVDFEF